MLNFGRALPLSLLAAAVVGSSARADIFDYSGTVVTYTIPTTGVYDIVAAGAQGGNGANFLPLIFGQGGLGAIVSGDVFLTAGRTLDIVVGGMPGTGFDNTDGSGGGGGTFVFEPPAFFGPL